MKKRNFIIISFFSFMSFSLSAKEIELHYIKLNIPDNVSVINTKNTDYYLYSFLLDNKVNILNLYVGNHPNTTMFEKPEKIEYGLFNNYKKSNFVYWNCIDDSRNFCSATELDFEGIAYPSSIQFFYNSLDKKYMDMSHSIIKSLQGPKILPLPEKVNAALHEAKVKIPPCFEVVIPPKTSSNSRCDSSDVYCKQDVRDISTIDNINETIGYIKFKTADEILGENNSAEKINLNPFFRQLFYRFPQMTLITENYSNNQEARYNVIINIPYYLKNKKYFLNVDALVYSKMDGLEIFKLINSLMLQKKEDCKSIY